MAASDSNKICFKKDLFDRFVLDVTSQYPKKAFGYFLADMDRDNPIDYIIFSKDIRNDMKSKFENYGEYYKIHEDAGFLATPEEIFMAHQKIKKENKKIVGVFHSHQRHPAVFTSVDKDLHPSAKLWHLIISLRNPKFAEVKIFRVNDNKIIEMSYQLGDSYENEL